MPNTSKGLPYPTNNAAANVPADIQALAQAVDAKLVGIDSKQTQTDGKFTTVNNQLASIEQRLAASYGQSGQAIGTFTALNTPLIINVTYAKPYTAAPAPTVTLTGWAGGAGINYSVTGQTATGFTITAQKTQGALGTVGFNWTAVGPV